jgi:hypothetical protein
MPIPCDDKLLELLHSFCSIHHQPALTNYLTLNVKSSAKTVSHYIHIIPQRNFPPTFTYRFCTEARPTVGLISIKAAPMLLERLLYLQKTAEQLHDHLQAGNNLVQFEND